MGDDFDVDALLEAPYRNQEKETEERHDHGSNGKESRRSRSGSPRKSRDSKRSRSRDRERSSKSSRRSRSRDRSKRSHEGSRRRSPDRRGDSRRRSRSRDRHGGRSDRDKDRKRRSRSRDRRGGSRHSPPPPSSSRRRTKSKSPEVPLTPEERDCRTVFIMQLSQRVRARDVEEFFSAVGKIRDVKLIMCNKTRRFKGIAYVEFRDLESVPLALGLNGQKLLGVPVIVQPSQAEKNRMGSYSEVIRPKDKGPMRLYVGSLHFNITEDMLRGIFEPFGKIQSIQLMLDLETGRSKGYGFVTYCEGEDAKKALEQLNGFELAGRPMKVGHVTERNDGSLGGGTGMDTDDMDRAGYDLGATGRLALMAKLAEGTGMKLPQAANQALSNRQAMPPAPPPYQTNHILMQQQQQLVATNPPIATQCFMLSNMFDPTQETNLEWDSEVRDDVIEECNKHGGVLHIVVDTMSPTGNVYVKCPSVQTAVSAVNALHGRWFAGKVITAAYVPILNYHNLFPDSIASITPLQTKR